MRILILSTVLVLMQVNFCISTPSFQVEIRLKLDKNSPHTIKLCNGVTVYERVILTTASCMQVQIQGSMQFYYVNSSMVYIYAGSTPQIIRPIKSIDIAPGYRQDTLENDIAILTLQQSLPLGNRSDIQWIMMDDPIHVNQTCFATFTNLSQYVQSSPITNPVVIEDQMVCSRLGSYSQAKRHDICSYYVLNPGVMCNATGNELRYTYDRGTPLVCNNKVVGLLSSVIAPTTTAMYNISCMQRRIYSAYYTRISTFLSWVYQRISAETQLNGNANISLPYNGAIPTITTTIAPTHLKKKNDANGLNYEYITFMTTTVLLLVTKLLY